MSAMSLISPDPDAIDAMRKSAPTGPIVMVNLIKFKAEGGAEAYARYVRAAAPAAEGSGAEVLYAGTAGPDFAGGADWDLVALVRYPDFDSFADVMTHPSYRNEAIPIRETALERALLMLSAAAPLI